MSAAGGGGCSPALRPVRVGLLVCWLLAGSPTAVLAGAQQYEPLADSVRSALAASVADRAEPEPVFDSPLHRADWLAQMAERLPRRWKPTLTERVGFLLAVRYEAQRAGLEPELVLGLIQVESNFRRYAVSSAGARGYMQVMPFWTDLIGDGNVQSLFTTRTNLRYGCTILRHYLDRESGNLFRALGRYNGSLGRATYPDKVLAAWRRWAYRTSAESEPGPR